MKKRLVSVLQLILGIGLIALLFHNMDNKSDLINALHAIASNWPFLLGALFAFLVCLTACAWRWHLILRAHDITIPFLKTLELYFVGQFFNAFMFGSVGGDLVKVFFVARLSVQRRTEAVTTVFIDRIMGMLALIALAVGVVLVRYKFFLRYPETKAFMFFVIALTIALIAGLLVVFRRNVFEHWKIFRSLEEKTALGNIISRVYKAFHSCMTHRGLLTRTLAFSLINHIAMITAAFLLGLGLNIRTVNDNGTQQTSALTEAVSNSDQAADRHMSPSMLVREFGNYLTVFPIVNGVAAIPATPGGLGTREVAAQFLLAVPEFNVPKTRSVPLSLLLYATTLFWSLVGGIVYVRYVLRTGKPTEDFASIGA